MPANVPYALIHGTNLDTNPGPNGDLTSCYYDGAITFKPTHENKMRMRDYRGVNAAHLLTTPRFDLTAPVVLKREDSTFGNIHPGYGVSRAVVVCAGDRGGHGFPMDVNAPGYFIVGDINSSVELGSYRKLTLELELFGFSVTTAVNGGV